MVDRSSLHVAADVLTFPLDYLDAESEPGRLIGVFLLADLIDSMAKTESLINTFFTATLIPSTLDCGPLLRPALSTGAKVCRVINYQFTCFVALGIGLEFLPRSFADEIFQDASFPSAPTSRKSMITGSSICPAIYVCISRDSAR